MKEYILKTAQSGFAVGEAFLLKESGNSSDGKQNEDRFDVFSPVFHFFALPPPIGVLRHFSFSRGPRRFISRIE